VHAAVLLHTARMLLLPQKNSVLAVGTANMHGNALALKLLWQSLALTTLTLKCSVSVQVFDTAGHVRR
jgi:hypothetical protein